MTWARYEDDTVCSAVYGYLWCSHVSQQSAGYGHNQFGYQCSVATSAGYKLELGGSQTCNIWLPLFPLNVSG